MALFESARQAPGTPYSPERFLAFLTSAPASGKRVADTFAGRRRLVRFFESVQMEFGICFTNAEWEQGFALDDFTSLVETKAGRPDQALRLAERRQKEARIQLTDTTLRFSLFSAPFLVGAFAARNPWVKGLLALPWIVITGGMLAFGAREYGKANRLGESGSLGPDRGDRVGYALR